MLLASPVGGKLFDNYGPRVPIAIGSFMHVFGLMMASLCKEYYQFALSQSVCSGIGASLIMTPCMTAVSGMNGAVCCTVMTDHPAHDILPQETSHCWWLDSCRIVARWCHIPARGQPSHSKYRVPVDDASLRVHDLGSSDYKHPHCLIQPRSWPETIQNLTISGPNARSELPAHVHVVLFPLLSVDRSYLCSINS